MDFFMDDQIAQSILENGITSPIVIVVLGAVCVYLYRKYEQFTEQTQETQEKNFEAIQRIQQTLEQSERTNQDIDNTLQGLKERIKSLEDRLNSIDGKSSTEMTSIIKDIESIKRFLEMCCMLNNKKRLTQ